MQIPRWSLRVFIPLFIVMIVVIVTTVSLFNALKMREEAMMETTLAKAQREVAMLVRHAERFLRNDPQVVQEDLSQMMADPLLSAAALIDPQGRVKYASDYSWRGRMMNEVLTAAEQLMFERAKNSRVAIVETRIDGQPYHRVMMSFAFPTEVQQLRGLERGVIYLTYDLSEASNEAGMEAVTERMPDIFLFGLAVLALVFVLKWQVTTPLFRLAQATKDLSTGKFHPVITKRASTEITELTQSFNNAGILLKKQVTELAAQAYRTQIILDNVLDGIVTVDKQGRLNSVNRAAERMFDLPQQKMLEQHISMLFAQPFRSQFAHFPLSEHVSSSEPTQRDGLEINGSKRNGEQFPMEFFVTEISYHGDPLYICVLRDITERRRIEKMKGEFVSTVSHELRTPLTAISGAISLLQGGIMGEINEESARMLTMAKKNTERLHQLINDLLDMEKIAAGKIDLDIQAHPVRALLEQSLHDNQSYAEQYQVNYHMVECPDVELMMDSHRFLQVMANLLSNAAKFSHTGEIVEVRLELLANSARIEVLDKGRGIPEEFNQRIFQKFSQADASDTREKGGTGLGLAITKDLIEMMGGRIGYTSTLGEGSCFYFELPLANTS